MEEAEEVQREAEGADLWDLAARRLAKKSLGQVEQRKDSECKNFNLKFFKIA